MNPYSDPDYKRAKLALKANPRPCELRLPVCTGIATTLDHQPRLAQHTHRRGSHCCVLVPACAACNYSDGATSGNARRSSGYDWP